MSCPKKLMLAVSHSSWRISEDSRDSTPELPQSWTAWLLSLHQEHCWNGAVKPQSERKQGQYWAPLHMPESSYKSVPWFEFIVNILGFEYATKFYKLYHVSYYHLISKSQFSTLY